MNLIRSFFIAFSMYSKIPMPRTDWTKESMRYAMCFFPVIGAVIGGLLYLWIYLTGDSTGSLFRAAVAVLIPIIITGGIHLDGLLDTADALSSYKSEFSIEDGHTKTLLSKKSCFILSADKKPSNSNRSCISYFFNNCLIYIP